MTQDETEEQNRSAAAIQEQTQSQYKNYGQLTSEQKQVRNEERKALKNEQKELKRQEREMKMQQRELQRQEALQQSGQVMQKQRASSGVRSARPTTPQRNAVKVSRSTGPGRK